MRELQILVEAIRRVRIRHGVRHRPEAVADTVVCVAVAVRPYRRGRKRRAAVVPPPSMSCRCHRFPFARLCVYLLLDVGELRVVLVVLLVLRAVDCRVKRSFHGCIIAKSSLACVVFHAPIGFGMFF